MTSTFKAGLSFALALACVLFASPSQAKDKEKNKSAPDETAQIQQLEQQWLAAYVQNNPAALEQIEADDFILTDPSGAVATKAEDIQNLKSGAIKWTAANIEQIKIRFYGKAAIASGVVEIKGSYRGQDVTGKYRFTDVFIRKKQDWHAVASQVTAISAK